MKSALDEYASGKGRTIKGWLSRVDAEIFRSILTVQNTSGLAGSVAEIGVHHGRGFVLLCLGLLDGERAYCIDIFDGQHLNRENSGRGDRTVLERNLQRFGIAPERVRIDPRSSDLVQPSDLISQVGPIRMFSIDGGHRTDIVAGDLALAEQVLADHGVIALDDFHRAEWPEVSAGYFKWFANRKRPIVPFAIGFKQIYLCQSGRVDFYQTMLAGNDFLSKLKAKTCEFQGITLPVYHRLVRPEESSLADVFKAYLRVIHPDKFVAAKSVLTKIRSFRGDRG
jgi:hypothetical protein